MSLVYCDYLADLKPLTWDENCRRDMVMSVLITILAGDYCKPSDYYHTDADAVDAIQHVLRLSKLYCGDINTLTGAIYRVQHMLKFRGLDALNDGSIKNDIHLILLSVANAKEPVTNK